MNTVTLRVLRVVCVVRVVCRVSGARRYKTITLGTGHTAHYANYADHTQYTQYGTTEPLQNVNPSSSLHIRYVEMCLRQSCPSASRDGTVHVVQ